MCEHSVLTWFLAISLNVFTVGVAPISITLADPLGNMHFTFLDILQPCVEYEEIPIIYPLKSQETKPYTLLPHSSTIATRQPIILRGLTQTLQVARYGVIQVQILHLNGWALVRDGVGLPKMYRFLTSVV